MIPVIITIEFIVRCNISYTIGRLCNLGYDQIRAKCDSTSVSLNGEFDVSRMKHGVYVQSIETLRFLCLNERIKHQPRRYLRSHLVLQRLCNEGHLAPAIMHFGTKSWSKMVVRWRYADLSMESSKSFSVLNV